ncbi:hypothetical protein KGR20_09675 [Cytobacillus oceanisediminis]|uniref:hypothetical protein n=1 Tax=Cytobacillus oceanisediminis TaxID=665099 RepID=UPI00164266BD|nr:hypothetical protein [Cytobacillus oceanisediminis]MBZ9534525.1 hypothetical protein [Cytobacillus oceanisediminis]
MPCCNVAKEFWMSLVAIVFRRPVILDFWKTGRLPLTKKAKNKGIGVFEMMYVKPYP